MTKHRVDASPVDVDECPSLPLNQRPEDNAGHQPDDAPAHLRDDHAAAVLYATAGERVRRAIEQLLDVTENERAAQLKRDDCIAVCGRRGAYGDSCCPVHAAALYAQPRNKPEPAGGL